MEGKLPEGWVCTELSSILKLKNGYAFKSSDYKEDGVPVIRISDIQDGQITTEKAIFVDDSKRAEDFVVDEGDILIAMSGATTGKYGIYNSKIKAYQNQRVGNLKPLNNDTDKKFIYYLLGSLKKEIEEKAYGGAQPNISAKLIEEIQINLPPLPEQQRIVAKLDSLFAHLEDISKRISNLKLLQEKFIDGCLIDQYTNQYCSQLEIGEYIEEGKGRVGENWKDFRKIGVSAAKGIIELSTGSKESFENYKIVQPGDFIYNTMRVNIGSIAIYDGEEVAITSPDYVVFRVKKYLSPHLLLGFLKSEKGILEIGSNTKGSVRSRLYFKSLSEVRMPVADAKVQSIAEKFLTKFKYVLRNMNTIENNVIPELQKALLSKAFKGEI